MAQRTRALAAVARRLLPASLRGRLNRLLGESGPYAGPYGDWDAAALDATGYETRDILARAIAAREVVARGEAQYEQDTVALSDGRVPSAVLEGLSLARAAPGATLAVLDFGGSLASLYYRCAPRLEPGGELYWAVVEQRHFVEYANRHLATGRLQFFDSLEQATSGRRFDAVLASSVLQYLRDPAAVAQRLKRVGGRTVVVARTPVRSGPDCIMVQRVPREIYAASYPSWIFNENTVRSWFEPEYVAWREEASDDGIWRAPGFDVTFRNLILRRREDGDA